MSKTSITIQLVEEELERVKSFNNQHFNNLTAVNFIVREYRSNLKKHLINLKEDSGEFNVPASEPEDSNIRIKGLYDDIIDVVSGMRFKDNRFKAATNWCTLQNINPNDALILFEEVGKGEDNFLEEEEIKNIDKGWRLPELNEMKTLFHRKVYKENKHRCIWLQHGSVFSLSSKNIIYSHEYVGFATFFIILVRSTKKGLQFKSIEGLYNIHQIDDITEIVNEKKVVRKTSTKSGVRRSTPRKSKSKFEIKNMKYVNFHYAFGNIESAPVDSRNFAIRGYIAKSGINPIGIKIKDFELNDTGIINARFYIDAEIKDLGLDIPLRFKQADYVFIAKYGPRMWIKVTGYKSGFDFDKSKQEVIDRYFDVADKYAIDNSYAKRIVVDNKPDLAINTIPAKYFVGVSTFR